MIVISTLSLAVKGVTVAFKEVWDRVDGKVTQPIGEGDAKQPITIEIVPADKGWVNGQDALKGKDGQRHHYCI